MALSQKGIAPADASRRRQSERLEQSSTDAAPSRRGILRMGLIGGALLALGGGGLALFPSRIIAGPTTPLLALEPRAFQTMIALAARIVTAKGRDPLAIAHGVDRTLSYASKETASDVGKVLGLLENALPGLLLDGRLGPFTRLSASSQDAVLDSWRKSRIELRRSGYQAIRKLALAAYYVEERSWPPLDYDPPSGLNAIAYDDSMFGTPEWVLAHPAHPAHPSKAP